MFQFAFHRTMTAGLGFRVRVRRRVAEGDEPVRDRDKGGLVNSNQTFLSLLYSSSGPFLSIARSHRSIGISIVLLG